MRHRISKKSAVLRLSVARIIVIMLLVDLPPLFAPNQTALANSNRVVDVLITHAKRQLEDDQRTSYAELGVSPRHYPRHKLEADEREADEKLLAGLSTFPHVSPADLDKLRQKLVQARQRMSQMQPPTQYEDIVTYRTVNIIFTQIIDRVEAYQNEHPNTPKLLPPRRQLVIGTLPTRNINAGMRLMGRKEDNRAQRVYLIEVNAGLLQFAEVFSNILARIVMPIEPSGRFVGFSLNRDDVQKYVQSHPLIEHEFNELIRTYLIRGVPYVTSEFHSEQLEEPYATLAAMLYRSMVVYTLAHELGHVIDDQRGTNPIAISGAPADWVEEYSADYWGMVLSLMANGRNTNLPAAALGARQYFACYDLVERGISMIATGQETYRASGDHPPANKRKERMATYVISALRDYLNQPQSSIEDFNEISKSSQSLESATDALWLGVKPSLLDLHHDRAQLAPVWRSLTLIEAR